MTRKRLLLLSLGGTITMVPAAEGGIAPKLGAADLVATVPALAEVAEIENRANLEIRLRNLRERIARGAAGGGEATPTETQTETDTETETETEAGSEAGAQSEAERATETKTGAGAAEAGQGGGGVNVPAIAGFSVAAVGLVTAAIFGPLTVAEDSSLSEGCGATRSCTDSELSTMRSFAVVTDVALGVSLAGAVVGVIFLVVGGGEGEPGERAHQRTCRRARAGPRVDQRALGGRVEIREASREPSAGEEVETRHRGAERRPAEAASVLGDHGPEVVERALVGARRAPTRGDERFEEGQRGSVVGFGGHLQFMASRHAG